MLNFEIDKYVLIKYFFQINPSSNYDAEYYQHRAILEADRAFLIANDTPEKNLARRRAEMKSLGDWHPLPLTTDGVNKEYLAQLHKLNRIRVSETEVMAKRALTISKHQTAETEEIILRNGLTALTKK